LGCGPRRIDERRTPGAFDHTSLARADDDERCHVRIGRDDGIERDNVHLLVLPPDGAAEHDRSRWRQMSAQPFDRGTKLPGPRSRDRIVKRDHETGTRRRIEPPLDQLPRLEIVGERERAEIVAKRRADPRRNSEHRRDTGYDGDVERTPDLWSELDLFANRRRHGEDAWVAAGDDGNARALRRVSERGCGA